MVNKMPKIRRVELLEEKIKQLELYHDQKCPERKIKIVRKMIKFYCKRLACL